LGRERSEEACACLQPALTILAEVHDARRKVAEVLIEFASLEGPTLARYRRGLSIAAR
jgi:hypothetical protein